MAGQKSITLSLYDDTSGQAPATVMAAELFQLLNTDMPLGPSLRFNLDGIQRLSIGRTPEAEPSWDFDGAQLTVLCADARISSSHARIDAQNGNFRLKDLGSKNGTFLNGARITEEPLRDGDILELGQTFFLFRAVRRTWAHRDPHPRAPLGPDVPTFMPTFDASLSALADVSKAQLPVLITGESGTGKEVVARAFHRLTGRNGTFIGVNCGALPDQLVESELFGAKRGAFSGAVEDREGLIRAADKGTLFLDEIGELPAAAQIALLRTLQEREVTAVGATKPVAVDIALVAATHRDLRAAVNEDRFRQDLLARLSGLEVRIPALHERKEDFGLLVRALLLKHDHPEQVRFTRRAMRAMLTYAWPANVRELEMALSLAATLAHEDPITVQDLPAEIQGDRPSETPSPPSPPLELSDEETARRDELLALLEKHSGNVTAVAREMSKARMQIHRWMKRYGIDPKDLRS